MNISKFKQLEVVNLYDGKILGTVSDLVINLAEGRIDAIIIPGMNKIISLFNKDEYIIPWTDIKKVGEEVILVTYSGEIKIQE